MNVYNEAAGTAAEAALFGRAAPLTGPSILVSSDAARALGMRPGEPAGLRILGLAGRGTDAAGELGEATASATVR